MASALAPVCQVVGGALADTPRAGAVGTPALVAGGEWEEASEAPERFQSHRQLRVEALT